MQRQFKYETCTAQYDNNGKYNTPSQCSDAIIKMSLKTDKYFFHFIKLIIIHTFVKYILKHTLTTTAMAMLILIA